MNKRSSFCAQLRKWVLAFGALQMVLIPATAFAERPEIDCDSLSPDDLQKFYDLSSQFSSLVEEGNYQEALSVTQKAMSMCTTDVYAEYMLGRLYELTGSCADAYYHYEILSNRPSKVKKENSDIYKEIAKNFKNVQEKCGDVVSLEIKCETPDVRLTISGLPYPETKCPYYGKVSPGAYTIMASREGYEAKKETINVPSDGAIVTLTALRDVSAVGTIRIRCPRGASKFVLVSSKGEKNEYACGAGYEFTVPADTYKIYLGDMDESTASTIVVEKQGQLDYVIPNVATTNCSATPFNHTTLPVGGLLMLAGLLGLGVVRRRRDTEK